MSSDDHVVNLTQHKHRVVLFDVGHVAVVQEELLLLEWIDRIRRFIIALLVYDRRIAAVLSVWGVWTRYRDYNILVLT